MHNITTTELSTSSICLKAGDRIELSGIIHTARDAAHQRFAELLRAGKPLPVNLNGLVIYYCGPCPARPGSPIGSCGPTTSSRMDPYTPLMLERGVKAVIGKGKRAPAVREALKKNGAVYLVATGGVAALFAEKVKSCSPVAFPDLGPEAVYRLEVDRLPLIVAIDSRGNDIFNSGE